MEDSKKTQGLEISNDELMRQTAIEAMKIGYKVLRGIAEAPDQVLKDELRLTTTIEDENGNGQEIDTMSAMDKRIAQQDYLAVKTRAASAMLRFAVDATKHLDRGKGTPDAGKPAEVDYGMWARLKKVE